MLKISNAPAIIHLILLCIALSNQGMAQQTTGENWELLFNGKDLTGWEMLNAKHNVEVKDGIIVATTVAGQDNGFLSTTKSYGDFVLELEVKTDLLLDNSGIQYRSLSKPEFKNGRVHGYQVQIENRPPHVSLWSGAIYDEAGRGFLYILEDDPVRQKAYVQNQWNHLRIEAIGTTSRVWINDIPTAHIVDDKILNGLIALQVHGGAHAEERGAQSIYMRNVRIQTTNLKPRPYDNIPVVNLIPNDLSAQEKQQGFELLFDGTTAKKWKTLTPGNGSSTWKIEDGMITVSSAKEKGHDQKDPVAMTVKQYGSFELKFDFKLHNKDAIVGIEYFFDPQNPSKRQAVYGRLALDNGINRAKIDRDIWKEWNQAVIKASTDNRVEYWLNGYKILEYQRDASPASKGHILFDGYAGDTISYRSIKIRELTR